MANSVYRLTGKVLNLVKESIPKPGHGQALLKMHAFSLNYRDIMVTKKTYAIDGKDNLIPLSDGAGEVVEVGAGVTKWKKGDRVMPNFMSEYSSGELTQEHRDSSLGGAVDGVAGQYVLANARTLVSIPEYLSYDEAATLPCAAVTAWNSLFEGQNPVIPGQTVLIEGTGGVSVFGLQLAAAAGARVIVTSSSDEKLKKAKLLGASETINYKENPAWDQQVLKLTNGLGVNHVIEVGGNDTAKKALNASRLGGNIYVVGGVSGWDTGFPLGIVLGKAIHIRGIQIGKSGSVEMFERMNAVLSLHKIKPQIDKTFEFDKLQEALNYLESGAHFGKIVVRA